MKPTLKTIKLFVSAVLWVTLAACGGAGSSGARDPSTDSVGMVKFRIKSATYNTCGPVTVSIDGVELGIITYYPAYIKEQADCFHFSDPKYFNVPGTISLNVSLGSHTVTGVSANCTFIPLVTKDVTAKACHIVEI